MTLLLPRDEEWRRRWAPWTPDEVHLRLAGVDASWGVTAGWAIDLYLGSVTREHDDIEITVPAEQFPLIAEALAPLEWDVVGEGRVWPYPAAMTRFRQTWLRDPATGAYYLDVFREPRAGTNWVYRRDPTIVIPYDSLYDRTADGIPFVIPEVVLLFKAGNVRAKDQSDFERVIGVLPADRRQRLASWIHRLDPRHHWLRQMRIAGVGVPSSDD